MNRIEMARAAIAGIRQACREKREPDLSQETLSALRAAVGHDWMRVYKLAEDVVLECYHSGLDEADALPTVINDWKCFCALSSSMNGSEQPIQLALTGMYPPRARDAQVYATSLDKAEVAPIPMLLWCPMCKARHIDEGEFATKPHHTHACQSCGLTWRPAVVPTVGVRFLPGFKNGAQ